MSWTYKMQYMPLSYDYTENVTFENTWTAYNVDVLRLTAQRNGVLNLNIYSQQSIAWVASTFTFNEETGEPTSYDYKLDGTQSIYTMSFNIVQGQTYYFYLRTTNPGYDQKHKLMFLYSSLYYVSKMVDGLYGYEGGWKDSRRIYGPVPNETLIIPISFTRAGKLHLDSVAGYFVKTSTVDAFAVTDSLVPIDQVTGLPTSHIISSIDMHNIGSMDAPTAIAPIDSSPSTYLQPNTTYYIYVKLFRQYRSYYAYRIFWEPKTKETTTSPTLHLVDTFGNEISSHQVFSTASDPYPIMIGNYPYGDPTGYGDTLYFSVRNTSIQLPFTYNNRTYYSVKFLGWYDDEYMTSDPLSTQPDFNYVYNNTSVKDFYAVIEYQQNWITFDENPADNSCCRIKASSWNDAILTFAGYDNILGITGHFTIKYAKPGDIAVNSSGYINTRYSSTIPSILDLKMFLDSKIRGSIVQVPFEEQTYPIHIRDSELWATGSVITDGLNIDKGDYVHAHMFRNTLLELKDLVEYILSH